MDSYLGKYSGIRHGKKPNKILITVLGVLAALLMVVMIVGIIVGTDSEKSEQITSAIAENTQLKQLVAEQQEQIEMLSAELERLRASVPEEFLQESGEVETESQYPASPREELQ